MQDLMKKFVTMCCIDLLPEFTTLLEEHIKWVESEIALPAEKKRKEIEARNRKLAKELKYWSEKKYYCDTKIMKLFKAKLCDDDLFDIMLSALSQNKSMSEYRDVLREKGFNSDRVRSALLRVKPMIKTTCDDAETQYMISDHLTDTQLWQKAHKYMALAMNPEFNKSWVYMSM